MVRLAGEGSDELMEQEEILKGLYEQTILGKTPDVKALIGGGISSQLDPDVMLYQALLPALQEVGRRYEAGECFVPEMLMAARAVQAALTLLRPLLAASGEQSIGKVVMGTVKGDVHDIGKNVCGILLDGAGFEVIDLGVNTSPEKFVEAVRTHKPDIVGMSAFLTTTMPMIKLTMEALKQAGLRDTVKVMAGGAPVTAEYAELSGADAYCADARATALKAKALIGADAEAPNGALAEVVAEVDRMMSAVDRLPAGPQS
jgi:methylmalonyl-CoA mutase cobalamin-binding domain/chain